MGCINAQVRRIGGINASVSRVGGIKVTVSLLCAINKNKYIKVIPAEAQWIDIDLSAQFNVQSNTKWEIL